MLWYKHMVAAAKKKGRKPRAKKTETLSKDNAKNAKLSKKVKKAKKPKGPPKKRGRKPKGGKILQVKPNDDVNKIIKKPNIILHLKLSLIHI